MSNSMQAPGATVPPTAAASTDLLLKNFEDRIGELEKNSHKTIFKKLIESASASALFLGLVLTFASLHETFIAKPEAERITRLSQFNQAVNSAAKQRQELIKFSLDSSAPQLRLAMASAITPQILNDISTARAMLRDMKNEDVGIPQLLILINEAYTIGDFQIAGTFVARAIAKTDVTPYLRSEARRYQGKLFYATGEPAKGRAAFIEAMNTLADTPQNLPARAYVLADLVVAEYMMRDCDNGARDLQQFIEMSRGLYTQQRLQLGATVKDALTQLQGGSCPIPANFSDL
ncbi:hypothetical protein ML401_06105 [Bradyrhizobium sp. 62B]|jgi:hypothetical protein|uniref:hypothetical protein n=1 Tax=Bradyrhizobium TaxID=374 RepID=UPI0021672FAB|nr:hypothetical protein [Bradyrhizobium centrosematis]MCS3764892.1 hypothetical protein [Bradyrhizobium centrosematis]MCS3777831.1 hypothetical protein [Bradyrhizobium centrosematis]WIW47686.1 hypothetical protein ML401_06105 [Bradyrhizobium sp. 62B]